MGPGRQTLGETKHGNVNKLPVGNCICACCLLTHPLRLRHTQCLSIERVIWDIIHLEELGYRR